MLPHSCVNVSRNEVAPHTYNKLRSSVGKRPFVYVKQYVGVILKVRILNVAFLMAGPPLASASVRIRQKLYVLGLVVNVTHAINALLSM